MDNNSTYTEASYIITHMITYIMKKLDICYLISCSDLLI